MTLIQNFNRSSLLLLFSAPPLFSVSLGRGFCFSKPSITLNISQKQLFFFLPAHTHRLLAFSRKTSHLDFLSQSSHLLSFMLCLSPLPFFLFNFIISIQFSLNISCCLAPVLSIDTYSEPNTAAFYTHLHDFMTCP